jgi:hypothetical protein
MPAVCSISATHADLLLEEWTSLPQFESRLRDEERELQRQRQETQQATVESDSEEEELSRSSKLSGDGARRQRRSGSVEPLFTEANSIPNPPKQYGPPAPHTPADTPRTSRDSLPPPTNDHHTSASSRSSIGSLPVEAAAAVEANEEDNEVDLEIPWVLCTRKYYWKFVDAKQVSSNTDQASSLAFLERSSWTEIMASWVTKEAIREAGFRYTQVQNDRKDGRRTRPETCFCIERPLQFDQVKRLVERTVEMYRKTAPFTPPPPQVRRSSFHRPPPPNAPKGILKGSTIDRDRTPVPRHTHPPLDRANSSMHLPPPPGPPPLDRSLSTPGPGFVPPPPPPLLQLGINPRMPNLQIPPVPPLGQYASQQQQPPRPQSPRLPQYPPQTNGYPSQPINTKTPYYPPPPNPSLANPAFASHPQLQQTQNYPIQQSPLRQSYMKPAPSTRRYDDGFTTSDSEAERPRRRRSKSRGRYSYDRERDVYGGKKKSSTGRKAAGALLGVGGLTALLDGLSGL